jgi:hypothetical protein
MTTSRLRRGCRALCIGSAAALAAACGSGGGQPSDFCKSVDALDSAVTQINQTSLSKSTISAVETSLAAVDKAVANLSSTTESEFADETKAVEAATSDLDQTVAAAVDKPVPANLDAARTSMSELTAAVDDLDQATSSSC